MSGKKKGNTEFEQCNLLIRPMVITARNQKTSIPIGALDRLIDLQTKNRVHGELTLLKIKEIKCLIRWISRVRVSSPELVKGRMKAADIFHPLHFSFALSVPINQW